MHTANRRLAVLRLGPAPRRQSENPNEPFSIFLIVTRVHGERRKVGAVERVIGFAADYAYVAFVERQRYGAGDVLLRVFYERVQGFAQRREPQSEINKFGILQRHVLLEVEKIAVEAEGLEFSVSSQQESAARGLVAAA